MRVKKALAAGALLIVGFATIGCGKSVDNEAPNTPATDPAARGGHGGWWCNEHGVPEGVCTRCNAKLVADFRAKGDWCKEHDLPDSQCFVCHPEKEAEFSAQYEARYGKKPPKPEAAEPVPNGTDRDARS
jgi:cobalt-zinc-cadmium efflux system membrane fusion protein